MQIVPLARLLIRVDTRRDTERERERDETERNEAKAGNTAIHALAVLLIASTYRDIVGSLFLEAYMRNHYSLTLALG